MTTPTLEVREVRKQYDGHQAVAGVSFVGRPGTVFGLLGPNGAGKTTTIRMIMDIIAPDSGEVHFFGRPRQRRDLDRVGYLPEERGLYKKMGVTEHLVFLGELHGLKPGDSRPRIKRWLGRLELEKWQNAKIEELSKGMQQKVQLVGTLLHDPDVVILDEPFSGLDPVNQQLFKEVFAEYKGSGKLLLFSTHIMEQAEKICDEICLISGGRVVLEGGLGDIKRRFGGNCYLLDATGDLTRIGRVPGVAEVLPGEHALKVFLADGATAPQVLRELVAFLDVREFRSSEPALEEIFIKVVRDAA
jgi:ABC-2 type transport system ATP-binding protein